MSAGTKKILNRVTIFFVLMAYAFLIMKCCVGVETSAERQTFDFAWWGVIVLMLIQLFMTEQCLSFDKQFVFYASYHDNFINQLIHLLFVWPILATALIFLNFTHNDIVAVMISGSMVELHVASIFFALCYFVYYLLLERPAGILAALMVVGSWVNATWLAQGQDRNILSIAGFVHLGAWVAQFAGHGLLEGRAPALLDNLAQSFFMAPLFVIVEALSWAGYRKEDFATMKQEVNGNIQRFNEEAGKKEFILPQ